MWGQRGWGKAIAPVNFCNEDGNSVFALAVAQVQDIFAAQSEGQPEIASETNCDAGQTPPKSRLSGLC